MIDEQTLAFVREHRNDDVRRLALKRTPEGVDMRVALQQIEGRQAAVGKLPSWAELDGLWFPPRLSMEQCSSEATALYKRALVCRLLGRKEGDAPSGAMTDFTGGFGIDFSFMAPLFSRAVYMERLPELCRIARHNFRVLGLEQADVREGDSTDSPEQWERCDLFFIDPARRDAVGRKTVAIGDCTPDLTQLQDTMRRKARYTLVKLSPMLDIHAALRELRGVCEVHAVCVRGECKELLFVMSGADEAVSVAFHCVNLGHPQNGAFVFTAEEERNAVCGWADEPGRFVYEPNAAILKCGGYRTLAERYGLYKLHPNSHLYTSDDFCGAFPGRIFRVEGMCGFGKKEVASLLEGNDRANLTVRNFPATVAELRKRLRLKEGGDVYLFATTLNDGRHVMIRCSK